MFVIYVLFFFFFNDTATTEIYTYLHTLSLHDALPIFLAALAPVSMLAVVPSGWYPFGPVKWLVVSVLVAAGSAVVLRTGEVHLRSEEHTSELQSLMRISYAVFCLKKKTKYITTADTNSRG